MAKLTLEKLNERIAKLEVGERLVLSGIHEDIYHASTGLGSTLLKAAAKSMAHYKAQRDHEREFTKATEKAFAVGAAAHCLVLEPELYDEKFIVQPKEIKVRSGKKWTEFKESNLGVEILTSKDAISADDMANAIFDGAGQFFVGGDPEKSYWYKHESGLVLKARIDYQLGDAIIDLKTTRHDTPTQFMKAVKYDYDLQDASYRLTTDLADMIFIGVGKLSPHPVFMCKQCNFGRVLAEDKLAAILKQVVYAEQFGDYPNIPVELIETDYSSWEREHLGAKA